MEYGYNDGSTRYVSGFDDIPAEVRTRYGLKYAQEVPKPGPTLDPAKGCIANLDAQDLTLGSTYAIAHNLRRPAASVDVPTMADLHAAAYQLAPEIVPEPPDQLRANFLNTLFTTPEYQALHEVTACNINASELAAYQFAGEYCKVAADQGARDKAREAMPEGKRNKEAEAWQDEMALLRGAGRAIKQAQAEVDQLDDTCRALGMGPGAGSDKPLNPQQISDLYRSVRNSSMLRNIMQRAGRFRRCAQAQQRQRTQHGYDDMVGVELSGDLGRLLPTELAMLDDEDFELDAMRRLLERQAASYKFEGTKKVGKGPIVICVDESGSMQGEPIYNAKAFALAMAWVAHHQGRWCCLVGYSGGTEGHFVALPPGKGDTGSLISWLEHFYNGGTTMDVPLAEVPAKWASVGAPKGKTDLILLTDAECNVPAALETSFNAWRAAEQVRVITLLLGATNPGTLDKVSDELHPMSRTLEVGKDDGVVERCMSI